MSVFQNYLRSQTFSAPEDWQAIETIDMHTGGEPLRVVLSGFPDLSGRTVLENRTFLKTEFDHLRTALMFEPRGHADMYGCVLTPPNDETADFGIVFLHNEGYSTMCGHAIIAISTLAAEMGWMEIVDGENELNIDAPCGRIKSFISASSGKVVGVRFHCVPSFVVGLDREVDVNELGTVTYDLAYGGAFYAYVQLEKNKFDFDLSPASVRELIDAGRAIKLAVIDQEKDIVHPFEADLSFLYGTIFIDDGKSTDAHSRNVCIFADGEVDRSPTGSGVSGRMAIHHARKEVAMGERIAIESIVGSRFVGSLVSETQFGPHSAVIPAVEGTAHVTGHHRFLIDPQDPFANGFLLR